MTPRLPDSTPLPLAVLVLLALLALPGCRSDLPAELFEPAADPEVVDQGAAPPFARPGQPAPELELTDLEGRVWRLSELLGRIVVLQWLDPECPFVVYAYSRGGLRELAGRMEAEGVAWLAINSAGPGRAGSGRAANLRFVADQGIAHPVLLDPQGRVARRYGARRAPEIFVIAPDGKLAYRGALDNAPFGGVPGGGERRPYVELALEALLQGKRPTLPLTDPYGCRIRRSGP